MTNQSYSQLIDVVESNSKWFIRRDCKECFGRLKIKPDNIYMYSNIFNTVKYGVDCELCNTRVTIEDKFIPGEIKTFINSNRCEITPARCKPIKMNYPYTTNSKYNRRVCENCQTTHILSLDDIKIDIDVVLWGTIYYEAYYNCNKCKYRNVVEEVCSRSTSTHRRRHPFTLYGVNKHYTVLKALKQRSRRSRRIQKSCLAIFALPIYLFARCVEYGYN